MLLFTNTIAQIDYFSRQIIEEVIIYKDISNPSVYYYAPSKLRLVKNSEGKPDFQMLKMRYVGTQCSNDASESHNTNIVQLRIEMPSLTTQKIKNIKKQLQSYRTIKLKPMRITSIDSKLLVPVKSKDSVSKLQTIGETNKIGVTDKSGLSTSKSYWNERVFTFSLSAQEASLLEIQINDKKLALTFSYTFNADTSDPMDYEDISGVKEIKEILHESDENEINLVNRVIFSDAFEISISIDKWPELIKEIDINESVPPAYAAVEVKCYDFYENLRPDLYLKTLEVAATSVDGSKEVLVETKFYSKQPEINTRRIHFPYAVLVNKPLKYRITELTLDGIKSKGEWQKTESCSALIDITTASDALTSEDNTCEIEVDESWFIEQNIVIQVKIAYQLNNKPKNHLIVFNQNDLNKEISFYSDKNTELFYEVYVLDNNSLIQKNEKKLLDDTYLYISKQ